METFAVTVFPVAKPDEWRAWADSIASGDRADAHRQMMRRLGIKREHIRHQASPGGDVMVLVWEGVEQDRAPELLADLVQHPQSEHERYIATHVIPDLHGADPTAGPPPMVQKVATFRQLYDRYIGSKPPRPPTPRITAYVRTLLDRYPEIDTDAGEDSPWADAPLIADASGPFIYFPMVYSQCDEASAWAAQIARQHGLVCYDPQIGKLRP